jgi:type I restriction enzyme R subunit
LGYRGFGLVEHCLIIKEEYRQRVEAKVWEIVETQPTIAAIRKGEAVTDLQLVALERKLRQELHGGNVQL